MKEAIVAGEMVPKLILQRILNTHLLQLQNKTGIIVDGYPREAEQAMDFEEKVGTSHLINEFNYIFNVFINIFSTI